MHPRTVTRPGRMPGARAQREAAKKQLPQRVDVVQIPQDDCWFRDSGCTVRDPSLHPPLAGPAPPRVLSHPRAAQAREPWPELMCCRDALMHC
jgi:hypothetical protein